jgi:CHRD domain
MKRIAILSAAAVLIVGTVASANWNGGLRRLKEVLTGHKEVPVISTSGHGLFTATISRDKTEIHYTLKYADLEGDITQSHIHFGPPNNTGGISVFLCSNLANPPAGTPACPIPEEGEVGEVSGTWKAESVIGPTGQGIEVGALNELIAAIRGGLTYVNVHTTKWPAGEIRAQISAEDDHGGHDRR